MATLPSPACLFPCTMHVFASLIHDSPFILAFQLVMAMIKWLQKFLVDILKPEYPHVIKLEVCFVVTKKSWCIFQPYLIAVYTFELYILLNQEFYVEVRWVEVTALQLYEICQDFRLWCFCHWAVYPGDLKSRFNEWIKLIWIAYFQWRDKSVKVIMSWLQVIKIMFSLWNGCYEGGITAVCSPSILSYALRDRFSMAWNLGWKYPVGSFVSA